MSSKGRPDPQVLLHDYLRWLEADRRARKTARRNQSPKGPKDEARRARLKAKRDQEPCQNSKVGGVRKTFI